MRHLEAVRRAPKQCFSNLHVYMGGLGNPIQMEILIWQVGVKPRFCISNKFPSDGVVPNLGEPDCEDWQD